MVQITNTALAGALKNIFAEMLEQDQLDGQYPLEKDDDWMIDKIIQAVFYRDRQKEPIGIKLDDVTPEDKPNAAQITLDSKAGAALGFDKAFGVVVRSEELFYLGNTIANMYGVLNGIIDLIQGLETFGHPGEHKVTPDSIALLEAFRTDYINNLFTGVEPDTQIEIIPPPPEPETPLLMLMGIAFTSLPARLVYPVGGSVDLTGLTVVAQYKDYYDPGNVSEVILSYDESGEAGYTVDLPDMSEEGKVSVAVRYNLAPYNEFVQSFDIEVIPGAEEENDGTG
jgi:hypothetical protein